MKKTLRFKAFILAMLLMVSSLTAYLDSTNVYAAEEITDKGDGITWVDASVQLPQNYASIIGFKVTFTLLSDYNDFESGYGGVTEDPNSADYNKHYPTYMFVVSKGAHDNSEFNEDTFTCGEGENYEHYADEKLADNEIVKIGVGSGFYVCGYLDNGKGYSDCQNMVAGDQATITYQGTEALFEQGDSILTFYDYTADFSIDAIEWITGTPTIESEEEWNVVEKTTYADIETVENSKDQNGNNYVNIIEPAEGEGPFPVILWIHGGGWVSSSRTDIILNETMEYFLSKGYAFASVEYTLSEKYGDDINNDSQGKQMIYDIKLAIRYLRAHADDYNLDTRFVGAMGESAGAHLALLLGTTNGEADYEGENSSKYGGYDDYSSDVQAVVAYSLPTDLTGESAEILLDNTDSYSIIGTVGADGIKEVCTMMAYCLLGKDFILEHTVSGTAGSADAEYDNEYIEAAEFMSPFCQVDTDSAPMYLIHGEKDDAVSITQAYAMELEAKMFMDEENVQTAYYPEATHVEKKYFDEYAQYVSSCEFMTKHANAAGCFETADDTEATTDTADTADDTETTTDTVDTGVTASSSSTIIVVIVVIGAVILALVFIKRKKK